MRGVTDLEVDGLDLELANRMAAPIRIENALELIVEAVGPPFNRSSMIAPTACTPWTFETDSPAITTST